MWFIKLFSTLRYNLFDVICIGISLKMLQEFAAADEPMLFALGVPVIFLIIASGISVALIRFAEHKE